MENVISIILAAGESKRMKSNKSKLVHKIYGKEIVRRVFDTVKEAGIRENIVVVGYMSEQVQAVLKEDVNYVFQNKRLGSGHAVIQAEEYLRGKTGKVLVLNGDVPILRPETLRKLVKKSIDGNEYATILTAIYENPTGYGRVLRDTKGNIEKIIEENDADEEQIKIKEVNAGIYCFDIEELLNSLSLLTSNNKKNEYYITDVIKIMNEKGLKTGAIVIDDSTEILGVNDKIQLSILSNILKLRINHYHMQNGVTIIDPSNTYIYEDVKIGIDTTIYPNTTIKSGTMIGSDCEIGPNAYIREGCDISDNVKVGSFVELKKVTVGEKSKIPHLSYIGDAKIGRGVNIGCGTITCNYDGFKKSETVIGDNSFVGSNVNFIAPVNIGNNSFIAAGSTITDDVSDDSLAVARQRQVNKEGWNKK